MNKEIKAKWLENLRSGKYQQGMNCLLSTERKYCCLGVLCETIGVGRFNFDRTADVGGCPEMKAYPFEYNGESEVAYLLDDVQEYVGIEDDDPVWALIHLNDSGKTFEEIAQYIEKNL